MDKKFTLELGGNAINVIFNALQDRPYREVAGVIAEIQRQVEEQQRTVETIDGEKADGE